MRSIGSVPITGTSRSKGQTALLESCPLKPEGGVSNVDINGNNTLQIKAIGVVISTFETLPPDGTCVHCNTMDGIWSGLRNLVVSLDSVDEYAQCAHARYTLLMHGTRST